MNLKSIRTKAIFELEQCGIKSANIDVEILLKEILEKDEAFIFSHPEIPLTNSQYQKFRRFIRKRKTGYPIAYLVSHKEFFGLDFKVNKNVLIPRPETEELVELAIEFMKSKVHKVKSINIIDIGTGCGNIITSIAANCHLPTVNFFASDISAKALAIAKQNAKQHDVDIKFYKSDLFLNKRMPKYYDVILANLPYVPKQNNQLEENNILKEEIYYEPQDAIFAEDNGTQIINKLLVQAKDKLNENGIILLEADPRNIQGIKKHALKYFNNVEIIKDLSGRDRFLKVLHNQ